MLGSKASIDIDGDNKYQYCCQHQASSLLSMIGIDVACKDSNRWKVVR